MSSAPAKKPAADSPAPAAKGKKTWLLVAVIAIALAGGGAAWFFLGHKAEASAADAKKAAAVKPAHYIAMQPAFVVNLADAGSPRYLQLELQLMTRDETAAAAIEANAPAIRSQLLMLFSQQHADGLVDVDGKKRLQDSALAETRRVMKRETGEPGVDAVYFTSFVIQ